LIGIVGLLNVLGIQPSVGIAGHVAAADWRFIHIAAGSESKNAEEEQPR
jgi:hypothetical protein